VPVAKAAGYRGSSAGWQPRSRGTLPRRGFPAALRSDRDGCRPAAPVGDREISCGRRSPIGFVAGPGSRFTSSSPGRLTRCSGRLGL